MAKKNKRTTTVSKVKSASAGTGAALPQIDESGPGAVLAERAVDPAVVLVSLRASDNAEHAAEECAGRARQIRLSSLDLQEKADALAQEVRASNLAGDCSQIEIDLNAARITVEPLSADRVQELTQLSQRLDRQIVSAQLLNAALTGVTQVLESVVRVRDIFSDPSLRA